MQRYPREEMSSFSWNTTLAGSYTGGTITYTDPKPRKTSPIRQAAAKRLLKSSTKADNLADAKRKIEAAVTLGQSQHYNDQFSDDGPSRPVCGTDHHGDRCRQT